MEGSKIRILLHICCAPCAVYPVSALEKENIEPTGFFYNPNIHPLDEYERRRETVAEFSRIKGLPVKYCDGFMQDEWEKFNGAAEQRCGMCYALRLEKAASCAKEDGFDAFTTTLLVSPYQKHELIKEIGENIGRKYGIEFYCRDFRPGFRLGQRQAKEMGLYRQKYCGCIISRKELDNAAKTGKGKGENLEK